MANTSKDRKSFSFQSKVLMPVVALLIAVPALMVFIIGRHIESQAKTDAAHTLATASAVFKNSLDIRERNFRMRLENAVVEPRFKSTVMLNDTETTKAFLRNTITEYSEEVELLVYTPATGGEISGVARGKSTQLASFERRIRYGVELAFSGETQSSLIVHSGHLFEVISVPVFVSKNGNLLGVLTMGAVLGESAAAEFKSLTRTEVLILAGDTPVAGTLSAKQERQVVASLFSRYDSEAEDVFSTMLEGEHFHFTAVEIPQEEESSGGKLRGVLLSSYESRLQALDNTRYILIGIGVLGVALSIAIIYPLLRNIMRPIRLLRDGAEAVGSGDFSKRIRVDSTDECGELANAFNRMTENVEGSRVKLEDSISKLQETQGQLMVREARLRESEESLRLTIEGARDHSIFTIDDSGAVLRWNAASEAMLGHSFEEAKALGYGAFFCPEDEAKPEDILRQAREEGLAAFEARRIRKDGTSFWADVTLSRLAKVAGSDHGGFVEIARDVTARKQAEEAMRAARDAAESSDRAKSEFMANMSHEVRTPMNGIIGMSSLLLDQDTTDEQREYVETIRASADSMLTILDDILDISKIESGQLDVETSPANLLELIEESVSFFDEPCRGKELGLYLRASDKLPGIVETDASRLRQALVAVLDNAVKFTAKGYVSVEVDFLAERDELRVCILDTGIGMEEESLEKIFDPFFQVESSLSRQYGGTGLGLAIARNVLELLGGGIEVESKVGVGSVFTAWIRVKVQSSDQPLSRVEGAKVLVVSDEAGWGEQCAMQIRLWGGEPTVLASSPDALRRAFDAGSFGMLIIDEAAERSDTISVLEEMKERHGGSFPKWVRLVSNEQPEMGKGVEAALRLPLMPSKLNRCIGRVLNPSEGDDAVKRSVVEAKPKKSYDAAFASEFPLRILVVEDNAINTKVLVKILRKLGYEAATAADGEKGWQAAEAAPFDFIFMDLQMPVMDGLESARRILESKRVPHPVYLSAFTANAHQNERDACEAIGFHDFVSKPARPNKITEALKRGYRWARAGAES